MRVVLDTNVLISAFIAQGICAELLEHCSRQHCVIASDYILVEFRNCLVEKFRYTHEDATEAANLIQSIAHMVAPSDLPVSVCRDPDDSAILGTAVAGHAACIVTGDMDLLVVREYGGIAIIRPAEFIDFELQDRPA
jgi:uncharacterized protein